MVSPNKVLGRASWVKVASVAAASGALLLKAAPAEAQMMAPPPERSAAWDDATTILALSAVGVQLVMPRVFYADPEVTVGWKARWHFSVLAPTMTMLTLSLFNEKVLKDEFKGHRPGCSDENFGQPGCTSYGMMSTHSFMASSAFGQGLGIFLIDTAKWSDGRVNAGALAANVVVPGVLTVITTIGRSAGNWESGGQAWGSAAIGAALGLGMGTLYAALQRPECGYGGDVFCW